MNRLTPIIGLILIGLGAYITLRPLLGARQPLTSSRWLDLAFAAFFLLRGVMSVRRNQRARARSEAPPPGP
jgi:hypothetical protein